MARFRRRSSKPDFVSSGLGEGLERPPSKALDEPSTSPDNKPFSTFFALWPSKSSPSIQDAARVKNVAKNDDIDELNSQPRNPPAQPWPSEDPLNKSSPLRLPRHVPIIIPDFAQPYAPKSRISEEQSPLSASSPPQLRRISQLVAPTDAQAYPSIPQKGSTKESSRYRFSSVHAAMNSSQVSLSASESGAEQSNGPPHPSNDAASGNVGIISPINQSSTGGANLSGLVCNVHRTTGQEPHALVGATTTILGDKLYVFGGRIHSKSRPQLTSELHELDLIKRHWTKIDAVGDIPPPRYFHSVCALGDSKLVCYGGMSPAPHLRNQSNGTSTSRQAADAQPEVVVMSDIHIFDVPTRKWFLVASSTAGTDGPQGRYAHCAAILPSSAVFASASAPHSAIHHNRPSSDPHSGTLGVQLDGSGGAEMLIVGGQDSANNYIEQISVFNLRSLRWVSVTPYDRKCGAYKSMVAPLLGLNAEAMGRGQPLDDPSTRLSGTSMLIYSNYNFLDVKLELQVRLPDGTIIERSMTGGESPPGLRFPNGGVTNSHFVVSGTYLTSSKHEYALWALDLRTLTWHRIDTAGSVFSSGSWNRGVVWNRRNQFVILGHRKRSLVDDYNHRRINFSHVCMVELEAFGLYDNPRLTTPSSAYVSVSSPAVPASLQPSLATSSAGGRQLSDIAQQLGQTALTINEVSDMELVAMGGERIPCNSSLLAKRWGPYFNQLLLEASGPTDNRTISDATTLRSNMHSQASRNSALTITPTGVNGSVDDSQRTLSQSTTRTLVESPNSTVVPASTRPRSLFLPHTVPTIKLFLHYLYTSALPPLTSPLCSPHILCSLLQMARPYQIDGLLEATVQRLHQVLDGRNAAHVFNAAAMAAGGGRATGTGTGGTLAELERRESQTAAAGGNLPALDSAQGAAGTRVQGHQRSSSVESNSTATSTSTSAGQSQTELETSAPGAGDTARKDREPREVWTGEMSSVIGLQKRGLRGLMEGRRLRERANTGGTES